MHFCRKKSCLLAACVGSALLAAPAMAQLRAFGEAEGYGAIATGGRGGTIYHVTNLNDSGAGSFRDAVSASNRIIVFDVGGVINLSSAVSAKSNLTIAGQTAPGGGITINGSEGASFDTQNNVIVRYLRFRPGDGSSGSDAGINLGRTGTAILDHVSVEFAKYDNIDAVAQTADRPLITIQHSIIADPISNGNSNTGQGFGAHLEAVNGFYTLSNNLWTSSHNRNPLAKVNEQFKNNIEYNNEAGYTTAGTGTPFDHDLVNNAFIWGPASNSDTDYFQLSSNDTFYATGNVQDANRNGVFDGSLDNPTSGTIVGTPNHATTPGLPTLNVNDAYNYAIAHAGASLTRDELDSQVISQVQSLGSAGPSNLYQSAAESGLSNGGLGTIADASRPAGFDSDNDGIADTWETAHGLNPAVASDSLLTNPLGYRMIEQYINELGQVNPSRASVAGTGSWNNAANWAGSAVPGPYEYAQVRGDGVSNGSLSLASGSAFVMSLSIGGNGPATGETVLVNGGQLNVYDTITVGDQNNARLQIDSGTINTYAIQLGNTIFGAGTSTINTGTLVINGGVVKTNIIAIGGGTPGAWTSGGTVYFNAGTLAVGDALSVTAPMVVNGSVNIDSNSSVGTISSVISGPGTINKWDNGSINLTGANTFTGGLLLRGGEIGASSDANLAGATSAITFNGGLLRINGTSLTNIDAHAVNWNTFSGGFDIAVATQTFLVNSTISGGGSVTKDGAGILQLNASNSYSGGTIIKAGAVAISDLNNLGTGSVIFAGGSLKMNNAAIANADAIVANWSSFDGGFNIPGATQTFSVNQSIGGPGDLVKDGAGTLILNASNGFTGNTIINAGVLKLGNPLALSGSALNFPASGGTLDLNGYSLAVGNIAGNGGFDLKGGTLTVGSGNVDATFSGTMSDTGGGGKLIKVGSANLTLSGTNAMSQVIVNGGGIGFSANVSGSGNSPFGTSSNGVLLDGGKLVRTSGSGASWDRLFTLGPGGGTLELSAGYGVFNSTGTVSMSGAGDRTLTINTGSQQDDEIHFRLTDPSSGKLSFTKIGSGRLILGETGSETWSYSGDTVLNGGTMLMNSGSNFLPFGAGRGNLVLSSGTFDLNGKNLTINALTGSARLFSRASGTCTVTLGSGDASGTFTGVISDTGTINIVKNGLGVQVFTGANAYAGFTNINAGILRFNQASSIGGSGASVTVASGAAAAAGYAIDQTFLNRIVTTSTGAAALAVNSSNALSFSSFASLKLGGVGNVSYTGTLTPNGTTFRLGGGTGTITLPNTNALTGANSLQVYSGGTVSLTASNNYTGGTTVNAGGVLLVNSTNNGAVTITGGSMKITAKAQAGSPSGTSKVPALTISGGTLDITNNAFIVDYTGASTIGTMKGMLDGGTITSSVAGTNQRIGFGEASAMSATTFAGTSVDDSAVLMRLTINGDANLDGTVNSGDFNLMAGHFNQPSSGFWTAGDLNADGVVNALDFNMLASNFGQTMPAPALGTLVPEPTSAIAIVGMVLLARRRRH